MTRLDYLHNLATSESIHIHNYSFSNTKKAVCYHEKLDDFEHKAILIDKQRIETSAEEVEVLSEEIAHYQTDTLYYLNETINHPLHRQNIKKMEARAKQQAIENAITAKEIQDAINLGYTDEYEIAEECGITVNLLRNAFNLYQQKGVDFIYSEYCT